jgi:hypothetical protein
MILAERVIEDKARLGNVRGPTGGVPLVFTWQYEV